MVPGSRVPGSRVPGSGRATLGLARLNRVPDLAGSNPRWVRSAASLSAVEARLGEGRLLPVYFPQWLRWPPASVRFVECPPVVFRFRGHSPDVLRMARSLRKERP